MHEISHSLGVHHAVDNSLGESGGFLWWGKHKTGRCGEVASTDAPGHDPFITVAEGIRPGLGPIDDPDDEVWGVDHRFARADESGLGLSDPEQTWALMSYCSDGLGQRRWTSAFERDEQIDGIRSLAPAGGGGGGGGSWGETGEVATQADVVEPPAGSRGVLISGTISAKDKSATIESALPMPYAGDAAPGAGSFTLRVEDAAGGRSGDAQVRAAGRLRRRRGRRRDGLVRRGGRDPGRRLDRARLGDQRHRRGSSSPASPRPARRRPRATSRSPTPASSATRSR